jgi:hypothetical protein
MISLLWIKQPSSHGLNLSKLCPQIKISRDIKKDILANATDKLDDEKDDRIQENMN